MSLSHFSLISQCPTFCCPRISGGGGGRLVVNIEDDYTRHKFTAKRMCLRFIVCGFCYVEGSVNWSAKTTLSKIESLKMKNGNWEGVKGNTLCR